MAEKRMSGRLPLPSVKKEWAGTGKEYLTLTSSSWRSLAGQSTGVVPYMQLRCRDQVALHRKVAEIAYRAGVSSIWVGPCTCQAFCPHNIGMRPCYDEDHSDYARRPQLPPSAPENFDVGQAQIEVEQCVVWILKLCQVCLVYY